MAYPTGALGTDVATAADGYIDAYITTVQALIDHKQVDADVADGLTRLITSMEADQAVLATVTDA